MIFIAHKSILRVLHLYFIIIYFIFQKYLYNLMWFFSVKPIWLYNKSLFTFYFHLIHNPAVIDITLPLHR